MSDDASPKPDFVPYNAAAAIALVKAVFPRSTAELLQQSTGVPMRQVTRWLNGDSRIPPKLLAKFEKQLELRAELDHRVRLVYADLREEGLAIQVARSALLGLANHDDYLEIDTI
ncbi:hypothetical protein [Aurantimonas sp. 22II-16-19i]|uniref:hypothetical protein n=1 Tax=Aurantimonas sp. 22II-16-19i TaxID=1317114 RepID=UPI0009F7EC15|nr:hypothetical protein [Aurantimonas sp. 22II-16-19i]ORE90763.1 hypothetical protein ATO4_20866 [Aurantimonas sp. 22II-16-19i]